MFSEFFLKVLERVVFGPPPDPVPTLLNVLLHQLWPSCKQRPWAIQWRLDQVMTMFIETLITEYHVHSSHALCSCVVTRLDHFLDTKRNLPREYIVAHIALPLPATSGKPPTTRTIGFLKFERCWRSWDPISVYEPIEIPATRREWHPADDTLGVYEPDFCPWASRRPTLLRSSRGLAVPLARALVAACALRRIHPDCIGDAYAHAWFARGLWERLVDSDAADGSAGQDACSEDSGCSKRGLLGRCVLRGKTPAAFLEVLTEKEVEECRAVEDRVLRELEASRAEAEVWLADSAAWDKRPLAQMEAIWDIREAAERGVWAGARSDLDRGPRSTRRRDRERKREVDEAWRRLEAAMVKRGLKPAT